MPTLYNGDPYWLKLRYNGKCSGCGEALKKGDQAFRFKDGSIFGESCGCGTRESQRFMSEACDEDVYNGRGNPY